MLLREMPADVRRMLQERIESLSVKEAAVIADSYFDADGRPKHVPGAGAINEISTQLQDTAIDESDINAVGRRAPPRQGRYPTQRKAPPSGYQKPTPAPKQLPTRREPNPKSSHRNVNLCQFHFRHGDNARYCEVGCSRFDEKRFPGNGQAGRT